MPNVNNQYLYRSPFNFLDPYTKNDSDIFFGRDDEIDDVYSLFEKTNLVIIYGPSGSGKSSLAQCGLVNRFFDWKPIEIRRSQNIIDSFFEAIEIETIDQGGYNKGLFTEEDCKRLRTIFDNISSKRKNNIDGSLEEENLSVLGKIVEELYSNLTVTPFFIFDQFEELFIENQDETEIENFSLLLSLITKRVSFSNVVICIQTEFFSDLVKLEDYNPNILNYKCEIKDPSEDNIKKIIRGTFKKFNINQTKDGSDKELAVDEKEQRINEIYSRIEKVGSHLPFVQIYLDKLYVLDFETSFPKQVDLLKNPKEINPQEYPLEFQIEEIVAYGQIDDILENHIRKVNTAVIEANNKIDSKGNEHAVIKFLKEFITKSNTRKAVAVEQVPRENNTKGKYYRIVDDTKADIIKSIWGKKRDDVDESLGDIIEELLKARIIKYHGGIIEFSHNFLVKVLNRISVDIIEFYKRQFNSAFDVHPINGEFLSSGQVRNFQTRIDEIIIKPKEDLNKNNTQQKSSIQKAKIEEYQQKVEFWRKSKNRALLQKIFLIGGLGLVLLIISYQTFQVRQAKKISEIERIENKLRVERVELESRTKQQEINSKRLDIHRTVAKVADESRNDLTKSYKQLENLDSLIKANDLSLKEFSIGRDIYHDLLQNYVAEPFYKQKIELFSDNKKREYIYSTKSRKVSNNVYLLFAHTSEGLYSFEISLDNNKIDPNFNKILDKTISAYEPYKDKEGNLRVIFSNAQGTFDCVGKVTPDSIKKVSGNNDYIKLQDIEFLRVNRFVALNKYKNKILTFSHKKDFFGEVKLRYNKPKKDSITTIKAIDKQTVLYTFKKGDSYIIYRHELSEGKIDSPDTLSLRRSNGLDINNLDNFKIDKKKENILFEDDRKIYSISLLQFEDSIRDKDHPKINDKVISFHQSKINSIDNSGNYSLIGNLDKTASLFYDRNLNTEGDEILIKTFKGHTDAILNVSFLGDNHILTASEDGTMNLWDISGIEKAAKQFLFAQDNVRIKFNKNTNDLYVGFQEKIDYNVGGILILKENERSKFRVKAHLKPSNINANSFDFYEDKIYVGQKYDERIEIFNSKGEKINNGEKLNEMPSENTINDLVISKKRMAIATSERLYYWPDLTDLKKYYMKKIDSSEFNSVDIHPSKDLIIAASEDKQLYSWNLQSSDSSPIPIEDAHTDRVKDAKFTEDGSYMISGSWDNRAILWQIKEDNRYDNVGEISHDNDVESIATKLDTENNRILIATGSSDNTVQLHGLNLNDKDPKIYRLPSVMRHDYSLRSVTFGENTNIIYSADKLGNIKKWDRTKFLSDIKERTEE